MARRSVDGRACLCRALLPSRQHPPPRIPVMRSSLARALRLSFRRATRPSLQQPRSSAPQTPISCIQLPSILALPPSKTAPSTLYELLLSWPRASRTAPFNAVGDTLVLSRSPISRQPPSMVSALRPRSAPHRLLRAAAGMVLADAVARERQIALPDALFNFHFSPLSSSSSSSSNGPRRLGIGLIPKPLRKYVAAFFAAVLSALTSACIVYAPHTLPYLLISAAVCFATRPDLHNFLACVTERAPQLAKRKTLLLDRIRVRLAPYIMKVRQPVLYDCGLFSVLTVVDHADYVYVYAGALSRWCLLGWYNVADDYNFDRYLSTSPT